MSCHGRGKTKTAAILLVAMVLVALLLPATVAASGPNYPWGWFKEWGSPWVEHKSVDVFLRYLSRWIRGGETDNLQLGVGGSYGSNEIRLLEEVAEANGWDVLYVADSPSGVTTPHVAGLEATSTAKAAKADFLRSVRSGTFDISRVNLTGGSMVTIVPANAPLTLSFHPVWRDYPISTATSCPLTSLSTANLASEWPFLSLLRPKTRHTPRFSAYTDLQERPSDHCDDLPPFP